jgi:predicted ester cyclase
MTRHSLYRRALGALGVLLLAACKAPAPPDYAAQYQPVVDGFLAGWNAGNLDGLDAVVAPTFRRVGAGGTAAEGLEGLKKLMTKLRTAYPDMKVAIDEIHFMQGVSFNRWTFTGTNTGPGDQPPTGKSVKLSGLTLLRYEGNKIVEEIAYFDALDWYQQLGLTVAKAVKARPAKKREGGRDNRNVLQNN